MKICAADVFASLRALCHNPPKSGHQPLEATLALNFELKFNGK